MTRRLPVVAALLAALGASLPPPSSAEETAVIETALGNVTIRLLRDKAPRHVDNFEKLALAGYYDGTRFHRVIPGYIVQGGSPTSRDQDPRNDNFGVPPGEPLDPEFNDVPHDRGVVSMARNVDVPKSAGSQFFIVLARAPKLDEIRFTVFGRVIEGMDVVDRMAAAPRDEDNYDRPLEPVVVKKVRILGAPGMATPAPPAVASLTSPSPATSRPTPSATTAVVGTRSPSPAPPPGALATPPLAGSPAGTPARVLVGATNVRTVEDFVNIRSGPGSDKPVLQKVRKGTVLASLARAGEWVQVELSGGKTGYVRGDMVEPAP